MAVHHKIQEAERQNQEEAILRARDLDAYGQPKEAFMLFDGFSIHKGVTPKKGKGNYGGASKTQKEEVILLLLGHVMALNDAFLFYLQAKIENRVIGGIIICGDYDTTFVYTVDQLMAGNTKWMSFVLDPTYHNRWEQFDD
jgi:hypothetical protein